MHFGSKARQTTMLLRDPVELALVYTRCMLSGLLFTSPPRSVLILGLGGGALARFCRQHGPQCRIAAVEKRALVVELAREYFALPSDDRFAVEVAAAEEKEELLSEFATARSRTDQSAEVGILVGR